MQENVRQRPFDALSTVATADSTRTCSTRLPHFGHSPWLIMRGPQGVATKVANVRAYVRSVATEEWSACGRSSTCGCSLSDAISWLVLAGGTTSSRPARTISNGPLYAVR